MVPVTGYQCLPPVHVGHPIYSHRTRPPPFASKRAAEKRQGQRQGPGLRPCVCPQSRGCCSCCGSTTASAIDSAPPTAAMTPFYRSGSGNRP
eukprot:6188341-Amphidinium_carterae.1